MIEGEELPDGWVWAALKDLGPIVSGGTPKSKDPECFDGGIAWVTPADLTGYTAKTISRGRRNLTEKGLATCSAKVMPKRSVLFSSRAPIGYVAIAANEISTNQGFKSVVVHEDIDESYLFYYLKSAKQLAERNASGTTFKEISGSRFGRLPIPIAPLPEQQRIVEKIETLFAELAKGEEALREVQKLLARYRQSVLKAAVTGTLTADWRAANGPPKESGKDLLTRILKTRRETWQDRGKYKEPVEPDTEGLPESPEGWVWASFDQLFEVGRDGGKKLPQKQYAAEGEYPVIDQGETFVGGYSDDESLTYEGTLPVILFGDHTRRFKLVTEQFICGADGVKIICPSQLLPVKFSYLVLKSANFEDRGYSRHFQFVRKLVLPLPPLGELEEIVDLVATADARAAEVEQLIQTELKRSAALRQSILKDAFTGKLVPQDPSDEPAEKLLERIRAARGVTTAKSKPPERKKATA